MEGPHLGLDYFELTHFPHILLLRINKAVPLRGHVLAGHCGRSSVRTDAVEFLKRIKHQVMLSVFPLLNVYSSRLIVAAYNVLNWGRGSVGSAKRSFNISHVGCINELLLRDNSVSRALKSDRIGERLSEFGLVEAVCDFAGSCNFIESFEILVVSLGCF